MVEIPESLLRRSAEAKAKALGLPFEQVLAEMKGEAPPKEKEAGAESPDLEQEAPAGTVPVPGRDPSEQVAAVAAGDADQQEPGDTAEEAPREPEAGSGAEPVAAASDEGPAAAVIPEDVAAEADEEPAAVITEDRPSPPPPANGDGGAGDGGGEGGAGAGGNGAGNGAGGSSRRAAVVTPRPVAPPKDAPEGVRTQRLLTVVKARAIQQVKPEPADKVNTWPHLMLSEFVALLAMTGFLLILSVILQAPLLEPANFNATPNPSKAPWYFLGLQELLSYFDPQIAGVTVPTVIGLIGFMMIPYVDRNPSTKPSDRKFAIMLYTIFLTGSATLTIIGVLFRGRGFNWAYPWEDGIFFDDLRDWVHFE